MFYHYVDIVAGNAVAFIIKSGDKLVASPPHDNKGVPIVLELLNPTHIVSDVPKANAIVFSFYRYCSLLIFIVLFNVFYQSYTANSATSAGSAVAFIINGGYSLVAVPPHLNTPPTPADVFAPSHHS